MMQIKIDQFECLLNVISSQFDIDKSLITQKDKLVGGGAGARKRECVNARHSLAYIGYISNYFSKNDLAKLIGRNHASIIHAIEEMEEVIFKSKIKGNNQEKILAALIENCIDIFNDIVPVPAEVTEIEKEIPKDKYQIYNKIGQL